MSLPDWANSGAFVSVTRTADELSIVCLAQAVPAGVQSAGPWRCFKLRGPFPFTQTGVLASFLEPLAEAGIPILAVSTFDTDYVLVTEALFGAAVEVLRSAGHELPGS